VASYGPVADVEGVCNPLPAAGGTDPEPLTHARLAAPTAFRTRLVRAVAAEDYARLAERDDRVQRAAASLAWTGTGYEVRVAVDLLDGAVPRSLSPDEAEAETRLIYEEIEEDLLAARRMGHDVRVGAPQWVPVDLELFVCLQAHALPSPVGAALRAALGNATGPGGQRGLFHPDVLTFGTGMPASRVIEVARAVTGVASVRLVRLARHFDPYPALPDGGVLTCGPLEVLRLDNDPDFPENGRLTLDFGGGQ
jgi:predicted phage baseplate assembly protein